MQPRRVGIGRERDLHSEPHKSTLPYSAVFDSNLTEYCVLEDCVLEDTHERNACMAPLCVFEQPLMMAPSRTRYIVMQSATESNRFMSIC